MENKSLKSCQYKVFINNVKKMPPYFETFKMILKKHVFNDQEFSFFMEKESDGTLIFSTDTTFTGMLIIDILFKIDSGEEKRFVQIKRDVKTPEEPANLAVSSNFTNGNFSVTFTIQYKKFTNNLIEKIIDSIDFENDNVFNNSLIN